MKYCSNCGQPVQFGPIANEHLPRFHCVACGVVHYENPKVIVGCLPVWQGKVMLCRRSIEPMFGLWNIPGGFMENDETIEQGALREMWEESQAQGQIVHLLSVYSVPIVNQVHLHFLVNMSSASAVCTAETSEIGFFSEAEMPWADVAFASNHFALRKYFENRRLGQTQTHTGIYPSLD